MVQPIRYISVNSNHTFDFNYQKASLLELLDALKRNDNTSAKLKKMLIDKARETLGLSRLPDSDRVTPFFHCQEGEFHVTFLYDSFATTSTPWEMIIANNFGELIPLFLEIYDLLKKPIFNSSSATIGNFSVFHHQNAISYHTNNSPHRYLEYNREKNANEDLSVNEINDQQLVETQNRRSGRKSLAEATTIINNGNGRLVSIKKSTTSTKKGRKNSLVNQTIEMSSSMPNLDTSMFTHRYATRHQRKTNSILALN